MYFSQFWRQEVRGIYSATASTLWMRAARKVTLLLKHVDSSGLPLHITAARQLLLIEKVLKERDTHAAGDSSPAPHNNESESPSVVSNSVTPWTISPMELSRPEYWSVQPFSRKSSQPRDQTQVPTLQTESLPVKPPGKPKNTGVSNLSLLQWIFPTEELNRGMLYCRRILYQLSYKGRANMQGICCP